MSSEKQAPVSRFRSSSSGESARSWFSRPKHYAYRAAPRHRKSIENDLTKPSHLLRYLALAAITVGIAVGVRSFALQLFYIPSESMEPTLCGGAGCPNGNDRILVDKVSYKLRSINRKDVVVFARPPALDGQTADKDLVKRVIGVAGDTVRWQGATLWLNNVEQQESYINPTCGNGTGLSLQDGEKVVPSGEVFVMGDNRCRSEDSRVFGPIATSTVVGKVFLIVWPVQRLHII